jgi:hypothetical protein
MELETNFITRFTNFTGVSTGRNLPTEPPLARWDTVLPYSGSAGHFGSIDHSPLQKEEETPKSFVLDSFILSNHKLISNYTT